MFIDDLVGVAIFPQVAQARYPDHSFLKDKGLSNDQTHYPFYVYSVMNTRLMKFMEVLVLSIISVYQQGNQHDDMSYGFDSEGKVISSEIDIFG